MNWVAGVGWTMGPCPAFGFGLGSFSRPDCAATLADNTAVNVSARVMNTASMNDSACASPEARGHGVACNAVT